VIKQKQQNYYKRSATRQQQEREKNGRSVVRIVLLSTIGILIAGILSAGCLVGYRFLSTTAYFNVQEIEVGGNDMYTATEIVEISGLKLNQNIFLANLAISRKNLLLHSWIRDAIMTRMLPNKIHINIMEYRPLAILETDGKRYLLSTDGVVFKEWVPADPVKLPIIQGLSLTDFVEEEQTNRAKEMLSFLSLGNQRGAILPNHVIRKITMDPSQNITVFPIEGVDQIRLGKNQFEAKLKRLYEILSQLHQEKGVTEYYAIDASDIERIALRQKP